MKKLLEILKKWFGSSKGFTLIELLVVIAILGVLAAGVLIAVNPAARISSSKDVNSKNNVAQMASALETYYTDNQYYPGTASVTADLTGGTTVYIKSILTDADGGTLNYVAQTAASANCTPAGVTCVKSRLGFVQKNPADPTKPFYCWKSATGSFTEVAALANCTP